MHAYFLHHMWEDDGQILHQYKQIKSYADYVRDTQLKNELSQLTRSLCKEFARDLARYVKSNPKAFWWYCNTKLKNRPRLGDLKTREGVLVQGDKEKADHKKKLRASHHSTSSTMVLHSAETPELNVNKARVPDGLHPSVLRDKTASIWQPLYVIFQK